MSVSLHAVFFYRLFLQMSSPFLSVFVLSVMPIFMLCSLTVCKWEEHRLRVFVNKVRRILGREMAEGRRQFNEEFHNIVTCVRFPWLWR
jgi:hypothetical protein